MKINDYIQLIRTYKRQIIWFTVLAAVLVCACVLSYHAGRSSAATQKMPLETSDISESEGGSPNYMELAPGSPSFQFPPEALYRDATPSNAELTDLQSLNLAGLYEEGSDTGNPSDSYAGRLYDMLSQKDISWISGLYDLYNYTPQQLAALSGLPESSVTTAAGIIPEFRNISARFVDGDQQEITNTSNAREIISIINVLHYYGVLRDMDEMEDCAVKLWNTSHSYSVNMGAVYYCDGGCLTETEEGNPSANTGQPSSGTDGTGEHTNQGNKEDQESTAQETTAVNQENRTADAGDIPTAGDGSTDINGNAASAHAESASPANDDVTAANTDYTAAANTDHTAAANTDHRTDANTDHTTDANTDHTTDANADYTTDANADNAPEASPSEQQNTLCPGHVDSAILAVVKGITGNDNLFRSAGSLNLLPKSNWPGWNEDAVNAVTALVSQDWYGLYGLNTADYPVQKLLDSQEIDFYMSLVPENASSQRKAFVRYALASVGKIPYYWGGKPSAPGYTGNGFGALTVADEDGRLLKGLDCSGWINWVYWSVNGRGLGAESTSTLLRSGVPVTQEELLPGDICIRINPMAHVVVFLGWTAEGNMLCIQETTGTSNNVEVGIVPNNWESYRRILE